MSSLLIQDVQNLGRIIAVGCGHWEFLDGLHLPQIPHLLVCVGTFARVDGGACCFDELENLTDGHHVVLPRVAEDDT